MHLFSGTAFGSAYFGEGTGRIVMDDVHCTGTESTLISCRYTTDHNCGHSEDAGVRCTSKCEIHVARPARKVGMVPIFKMADLEQTLLQ